jgi:FtsZ-interacting cell division protein YlmF
MQTTSFLPQVTAAQDRCHATVPGFGSVLVVTPRQLQDAATVIRAVRENSNVLVNSSWLEDVSGQRLIDFVCGGLEAIGGQVHRIAEEVFLFTPGHACVTENRT